MNHYDKLCYHNGTWKKIDSFKFGLIEMIVYIDTRERWLYIVKRKKYKDNKKKDENNY